ncbi:MAG: glycosyltransferase family 4 protein [Gemmatimonadaceae bacterium]
MGQPPRLTHVFVTQDYGPDLGGMARRHVELCRRLGGAGAADEVIVSTVDAPGAREFDAGEPYAIRRQPFPFAGAKRFTSQARWARWLVRHAAGASVLHCGNVRPLGYAVLWAHRRVGVPYLVYVNGGDLLKERRKTARNPLKRAISRRLFAAAGAVVANSRWTAELAATVMHELGVRTPPPVVPIDLGTDPSQFHPSRDSGLLRRRYGIGERHLLVTVARLVPHKGQDVAMRALARLAARVPDVRYLLVGKGPDEGRLRALAAELGVADRVVFAGALPDAEVAEAYATATLYVGLSRVEPSLDDVEGFGISFVEAGASGTPSVAGATGGVPSAVRGGETGVLVPPTDVAAVERALHDLLTDGARRLAMGAAARRAVETHYNWDRAARETRELAAAVAAGRRPAVG